MMASKKWKPIIDRIIHLKSKKKVIIVAHNYQLPEVQEIADFVGDSLAMAQFSLTTDAQIIVVCGVNFMVETVSILNPDKIVLTPDKLAGCSLSESITVPELLNWKKQFNNSKIVSYINTSAEIKAQSDICCTSSNAIKVVESLPSTVDILFIPDMFLGLWVQKNTNKKINLWNGACHVHTIIHHDDVVKMKKKYQDAKFLLHPECGCSLKSTMLADEVLSTDGIINYVRTSQQKKFIVGTETGILHRLQKENKDSEIYPITKNAICKFMKKITLEKILWCLEDEQHSITIEEEIKQKARLTINRMLSIK